MNKFEIAPLCPQGGKLTAYLHDFDTDYVHRGSRPGILVIPGGGYQKIVDREKDGVAFEFFAAGFNTFVLDYTVRTPGADLPPVGLTPLIQASAAILAIREHADQWNTRENQIAVLGFSAGGHLAASCACMWDCPELKQALDTKGGRNRPDAAVLCYPVILSGEFAHRQSIANLSEDDPDFFDLASRVGAHVPPTFLWTTGEDELVPCENTLFYACKLQQYHVPYELHIYTHGRHGLTLGKRESNVVDRQISSWVLLCKQWLGDLFDFEVSI